MSPNQILKQTRLKMGLTIEEMAVHLRLTAQRISQLERGAPISMNNIKEWHDDSKLPNDIRDMVNQMWLAVLDVKHQELGEQLEALGQILTDR